MENYRIVSISERPELRKAAAAWFHQKWDIPEDEYLDSIDESFGGSVGVPQWYVVLAGGDIVGGVGVIDNDFHERTDLAPNVCALYVERQWRRRGLAGLLLERVCRDMKRVGFAALYLVTEHYSFYERYGWKFIGWVKETGSDGLIRMYGRALDC